MTAPYIPMTETQIIEATMTYEGVARLNTIIQELQRGFYERGEMRAYNIETLLLIAQYATICLSIERRLGLDRNPKL